MVSVNLQAGRRYSDWACFGSADLSPALERTRSTLQALITAMLLRSLFFLGEIGGCNRAEGVKPRLG